MPVFIKRYGYTLSSHKNLLLYNTAPQILEVHIIIDEVYRQIIVPQNGIFSLFFRNSEDVSIIRYQDYDALNANYWYNQGELLTGDGNLGEYPHEKDGGIYKLNSGITFICQIPSHLNIRNDSSYLLSCFDNVDNETQIIPHSTFIIEDEYAYAFGKIRTQNTYSKIYVNGSEDGNYEQPFSKFFGHPFNFISSIPNQPNPEVKTDTWGDGNALVINPINNEFGMTWVEPRGIDTISLEESTTSTQTYKLHGQGYGEDLILIANILRDKNGNDVPLCDEHSYLTAKYDYTENSVNIYHICKECASYYITNHGTNDCYNCEGDICESCQDTCELNCENCEGNACQSCQDICQDSCQTDCQNECQSCQYCESVCEHECQNCEGDACQTCQNCEGDVCQTCQNTCEISCQNCEGNCESTQCCEEYCETSCESCMTACQLGCEDGCQDSCQNCEGDICESSCQHICETCESACEETAQCGDCQYGCQDTCEWSCQDACENDYQSD